MNWLIILRKQPADYRAFPGFCPEQIANYTERDIEERLTDPGIVRNRLKVESIVRNVRAFLEMENPGRAFRKILVVLRR